MKKSPRSEDRNDPANLGHDAKGNECCTPRSRESAYIVRG